MPPLNKFINNVQKHHRLMDKNLAANVIRHESIVTGNVKAKRAQAKIESFLAQALHIERQANRSQPVAERVAANRCMEFLQPPDRAEIGTKVLRDLAPRFRLRHHGFTRVLKLEPRLGEDKAPQSVLELVDLDYSVFFWYVAKVVARLELQKLPLDELTQHNMRKLAAGGDAGAARFRAAVEECKVRFFLYNPQSGEVESASARENLRNVPRALAASATLLLSKKFKTMPRPPRQPVVLPQSPFLKESM